jgi:hypothetical protein
MTAIRAHSSSAVALAGAALVGTAAGVLTGRLQSVLASNWSTIANSGAVWTVVAFAAAAGLGRTRNVAIGAGLLVLVGEVIGYYGYLAVRDLAATPSAELLWTLAALWIGPLAGLGAFATRWGTAEQRMLSLTALAGVVAGEGVHLIRLAGLPKAGWVEVTLAGVLAAAAITSGRVRLRVRLGTLGLGALIALSVSFAYGLPLLG